MKMIPIFFVLFFIVGCNHDSSNSTYPPVTTTTSFADTNYFDIDVDAKPGEAVYGRLNYPMNYKPEEVSGDLNYELVDSESQPFDLINQRDSNGRLFGEFILRDNTKLSIGPYLLKILLKRGSEIVDQGVVRIEVVEQTQWQKLQQKSIEVIKNSARLDAIYPFSDDEATYEIEQLNDNNGALEGYDFYYANNEEELLEIPPSLLASQLILAANTINSLASLHTDSDQYGPNGEEADRSRLREALYKAINRYVEHFPLKDFANNLVLPFNDLTHQWRFTDQMSAAGVHLAAAMREDIAKGDELAKKAKENLHALLQITFDLPYAQRQPEFNRYFLENNLALSQGAWSDANRHHRMRSWFMMATLWTDYNRPITYMPWWYPDYEPFAQQNTTLLPGWYPQGIMYDLNFWLETNARFAYKYGQSGILPDGTISHHVGARQDMAFFAYGFEWMAGFPIHVISILANTPWEVSNRPYNDSANFLVESYDNLLYKGGLDFQVAGRSHVSDTLPIFGEKKFVDSVDGLLAAKGENTSIEREQALINLRNRISNGIHEKAISRAYWNSDFLLHRQSGENGQPFYMSHKMNSSRTMGAEGFKPDIGYHNGGGILQILVAGDEYSKIIDSWDWHALPGLTEELREDELPLKSDFKMFNPKHFAGVLSNQENGFSAFKYDSEAPYNSAAADKSVAFINNMAIAQGSNIKRTRNGERLEVFPIITTVDQAAWDDGDLTYQIDNGEEQTVYQGSFLNESLSVSDSAWFHQGSVGYLILSPANLVLRGGSGVNSTHNGGESVYHIAFDHGKYPSESKNNSYQYVAIPNVSAVQMPGLLNQLKAQLVTTVSEDAHAVYYSSSTDNEYLAITFYSAGTQSIQGIGSEPLTVTVDKPALVMLQREGKKWSITAQDPMHHVDRALMEEGTKRLRFFTLEEANNLSISVNLDLEQGSYLYNTQGRKQQQVDGQSVNVTNKAGISNLVFQLPDKLDSASYDLRYELYTGMPASISVPIRE